MHLGGCSPAEPPPGAAPAAGPPGRRGQRRGRDAANRGAGAEGSPGGMGSGPRPHKGLPLGLRGPPRPHLGGPGVHRALSGRWVETPMPIRGEPAAPPAGPAPRSCAMRRTAALRRCSACKWPGTRTGPPAWTSFSTSPTSSSSCTATAPAWMTLPSCAALAAWTGSRSCSSATRRAATPRCACRGCVCVARAGGRPGRAAAHRTRATTPSAKHLQGQQRGASALPTRGAPGMYVPQQRPCGSRLSVASFTQALHP
jgi:hypothetical protein